MKTRRALPLLAAFGVLPAAAAEPPPGVDFSQWTCSSCPFDDKAGTSGTLEGGVGNVDQRAARFGRDSGLDKSGAYLVLGGSLRYRDGTGTALDASASDLGLDSRALQLSATREGRDALRLGYAEIPHRLADDAMTPFIGRGAVLTLPAGYPAGDTASMPLATTLRRFDIGTKRSRLDLRYDWLGDERWSATLSLRHETRDGTLAGAGSFFSTSAQLPLPADQVTDQIELAAHYSGHALQASLAYEGSLFRNGHEALTWANPFTPVVPGADAGQLALAPDNQAHRLRASGGIELGYGIRASGEVVVGRLTQDQAYLAATLNPDLAAVLPALPANSLNGLVDTFDASVRVTMPVVDSLRLTGSYVRSARENRTDRLSYPAVQTDMFLAATPRGNQPFSFTRDHFRLGADYRGPYGIKASLGADHDRRDRTLQEVVTTEETTGWGRVAAQPLEMLSLALEYSHGERTHSTYGVATWVNAPQNPLLRKFYLADRQRDRAGLRADVSVTPAINVGLTLDGTADDYTASRLGLLDSRQQSAGVDLSYALSEQTRLHVELQAERARSRQAGSQAFAQPDWWGRSDDEVHLAGAGVTHSALGGQLELGAEGFVLRSKSDTVVAAGPSEPPFPTARTTLQRVQLQASYRLSERSALVGRYVYERYLAHDWHTEGVGPATVYNLLAFGEMPPHYRANAVQLAWRYRF